MKKKTTSLLAALLLLAGTTFATAGTKPSLQTETEFNHLFANAADVNWQEVSRFYKVTFRQDGQYLTAFFNPTGKFESLSRNITTTVLPLVLQKKLQEKQAGSWVSESFELLGANGTKYYTTLEDADAKTVYRSSGAAWVVYKKTKK